MFKTDVTVDQFMTQQPQWILEGNTIEQAREMMFRYRIRHLPVKNRDGKVVGMLSEREVNFALGLESLNSSEILVADLCKDHPYIVGPKMPLKKVAKEMAQKHLGSALVEDQGELVGIFTTVDACRALACSLGENDFC